MIKKLLTVTFVLVATLFIASRFFTIFVIQPIGAIPDGKTVIIKKMADDMPFIDSADAMCKRRTGGVSLLCRGMALAQISKAEIYARFPYLEWLYLVSTGGEKYNK